jgi:hypothetical protein
VNTLIAPLYRVVCAEYVSKTMRTQGQAEKWMRRTEAGDLIGPGCSNLHTIEIRPSDGPWVPLHRYRAARVLAAPVGLTPIELPDGTLIKMHGGWSKETAARANSVAEPGSEAWVAELGSHEDATLTGDGLGCRSDVWCRCVPQPGCDVWVRYERYTGEGRVAHEYVCPTCRGLVQSG